MTDNTNFEEIISDKLPKLDVLDVINKKFENFKKKHSWNVT
jgi:hypothetical protein